MADDRETNLGATPHRGPSKSEAEIAAYYGTARYAEFERAVRDAAAARDLELESVERVVGMWKGDLEPAASVWLRGDRDAATAMAGELCARYEQEAVLVFTRDEAGDDLLLILPGVRDPSHAKELLSRLGVDGGRFVDGALEIADETGAMIDAVQALARELGHEAEYAWGSITWVRGDREGG